MGIYTKLSTEDYKELEKKFILHCEADPKTTDYDLYVDSSGVLTFGIGFNIECNPNWLSIAILQKISGLKPLEEIDKLGYKSNILLYSNGKYDKFIEGYCKGNNSKLLNIIRKHKTDYKVVNNKKIPHIEELSKNIQKLIDEYNKQEGVEKIPVKDFSLKFKDEEISIIYDIGKKEYDNKIKKYFLDKNKPFNEQKIKGTKLYISLLSLVYVYGDKNIRKQRSRFLQSNRSRFLLWFILRYKIFNGSKQWKRHIHEAAMFGLLEPQKDNISQADIPATITDIFSYLNFPVEKDGLSYLDKIKTETDYKQIDEVAKNDRVVCFSQQERYKIIPQSIQKIDNIENYFTDNSFFKHKFLKGIIDFAVYDNIFSIFTQFIKESFVEALKNKTCREELFLLENIYVIDCINKESFLNLMEQKYSDLQSRCEVLLFLNSTSDVVNDISILQSKCPQVYFTIAMQSGYTYSFKLDKKSSSQTNIMLYTVKDGKYIPELVAGIFKAEEYSQEENIEEKNILLFNVEGSDNLSGRLSNNANIFHITHTTNEDIISKVKLYNFITAHYAGNIQLDMQGKEYEVSSSSSSGEFKVDITFNILDNDLKADELEDKPYFMYVNNTGEIFESKVSKCRAVFNVTPVNSAGNQKVLFSFDREDFISKKQANGKSLDFILINKTDRENKQIERTFNINLMDIYHNIISSIELDNIEELAKSNVNRLNLEHRFKAYCNVEDTSKIKWGYMLLNDIEFKILSNINVLKPSMKIYDKFHQLSESGEILSIVPNKILSKEEVKKIENNNYILVPIPYFNVNYIELKNFNSNIHCIRIVNDAIIEKIIPLNFYIIVDNFGKNGFLVRYTYKTVENAVSYHTQGELIGFKADLKVFPEKYGLYAVSPEATNSIVSHVKSATKDSQYVSASTLPNGAERFNVKDNSKKLYIDINKLKQSGATLISTEEISTAFIEDNKKLMSKNKVDIHAVIKNNEVRHKAIVDQEVLIKGADKKSAKVVFTSSSFSKANMFQKFGKTFLPLSYILITVNFVNASIDSAKEKSIEPIAKEVTEQVIGWGGAFAGMWVGSKIGSFTGSIIGTPGLGTVVGGILGSFVGSFAGYFGMSKFLENNSDED